MGERFDGKSIPWLKYFLTKRGIQVSDKGRSKRKAEVVSLAVKASELKLQWINEDDGGTSDMITSKLKTEEGAIPCLENIQSWSYDFSKMPPFTIADMYTYFIDSGEYIPENLKFFKSLLGYKLFSDGLVQDCMMHCVHDMSSILFKFKVFPTERSKTDDNKQTYNGFIIMEDSGVVKDRFCPCEGG